MNNRDAPFYVLRDGGGARKPSHVQPVSFSFTGAGTAKDPSGSGGGTWRGGWGGGGGVSSRVLEPPPAIRIEEEENAAAIRAQRSIAAVEARYRAEGERVLSAVEASALVQRPGLAVRREEVGRAVRYAGGTTDAARQQRERARVVQRLGAPTEGAGAPPHRSTPRRPQQQRRSSPTMAAAGASAVQGGGAAGGAVEQSHFVKKWNGKYWTQVRPDGASDTAERGKGNGYMSATAAQKVADSANRIDRAAVRDPTGQRRKAAAARQQAKLQRQQQQQQQQQQMPVLPTGSHVVVSAQAAEADIALSVSMPPSAATPSASPSPPEPAEDATSMRMPFGTTVSTLPAVMGDGR